MVTMELSKVTSKTSSIKALLLKAWRERWSDLQWGIHIKTILPRGVSGDVYNLGDCILQQALIGPGPNHLVLSYLKHSLSSQLISYAALLQHISKYTSFHKPYCIISLLELLESSQVGLTCRGKSEEGILATSVASTILWLLQCYLFYINKIVTQPPYEEIINKCISLLSNMLSSDFTMAILYLANYEEPELVAEVVKKCKDIEQFLSQNPNAKSTPSIETSLQKLHNIDLNIKSEWEPVTYCLQPLLAVEVMLSPGCETNYLVNKLLMLQRLKGYSNSRLYCDIMRACLISLNSVLGTSEESLWGAFTILKLPQIFKQLHCSLRDDSTQSFEYSQDIVDSFDLLLQLTPLLDIMDSKCNCNFVECILNELLKVNLISGKHVAQINEKRESMTNWIQEIQDCNISQQPLPKVIIRAEPTLSRLLRTLDADNIKMEGVQTVLCPILGKSFDLITAVAAVDGKLRTFVTKLIKFNETYKYGHGEGPKQSQTRALLFDVSFLMLCSIVNTYGSQVVLSEEGTGDSFFELWVRESMIEKGHPKSPESILNLADTSKVDALLAQFNSNEDFKTSQVKWNEICLNVPAAIKEVVLAWEQGTLSANDVKRILDSMRSKFCCLPICATAWLCSYMQILHQDALLKPMNMVQQFLAPPNMEDQNETFKSERFTLMSMIIRRMQYNTHPSTSSKISLQYGIISNTPISTQLEKIWTKIHKQGWVSIEATHQFQSLLNTGGPSWFITNILKEVTQYKYQEDLNRAVDLAFALFHLDIVNCTLFLLTEILPQYLHNKLQCEELVEPQLSALAKLSVYCIIAAAQATSKNVSSKKRARKEMESEDDSFYPASKHLKLNNGETSVGFPSNSSSSPSRQQCMAPALQAAFNDLFNAFMMISNRGGEISQQTHFVYKFLEMMVKCGREKSRIVLQGQPLHNLLPNLIRWLPDMVNVELIAGLYDVTTSAGRRAAARDLCMLTNLQAK